jgi:hypothetical protein
MNTNDFEETLRTELKNLNINLLDIFARRKYLCVEWSFEEGRKFSSCFAIPEAYLAMKPDEVLYKIVKSILYAINYADNIVSEIVQIKPQAQRAK